MSTPRASVIVLAWNGIEYLEDCLDAVLAQDYADFETIVVDNGSTDGSPDLVAERFPQVHLIRNERNLGFASGNNVGLRAAAGDLLVLLNQDTHVHPGWLAALAGVFDDPALGIAGCKLLFPDGTIQHAGAYLYGPRGESKHVGCHSPDEGQFDHLADADFVTGAALAINRTALDKCGPLDEGFSPAYYEDVDWCYRVRAAGCRVVYQPQAVATHYESTAMDPLSHERRFAENQGRLRLLFKHWSPERLVNEFGPAELDWLAVMDRSEELMAARRAYLNTILTLSSILAFRGACTGEAEALVGLLTDLRAATADGLVSRPTAEGDDPSATDGVLATADRERADLLRALEENQLLREYRFASEVPLLGHLIVVVRELWNSVAAKWYVRPLYQQQSVFNAQVVSYLHSLEHRSQGEPRDVAENIRELTALAERLAELTRQTKDLALHHREESTKQEATGNPAPDQGQGEASC